MEEYRGKSGLIGGDRDALTSANFMAHYNPSVQGRALGHHIGEMASAHYEYHPAVDQLNAAMSGARAEMLVNQTVYLKSMMRSNPRIDWNNDWKIVGILIGANDGCSMCRKGGQYRNITQAADNFESEVRAAIASLAQVPRVLVNVLPMLTNMTNLWRLNEASLYCRTIHDTLARSECGCAFFGGKNETDTLYFDKSLNAFADRLERIVADWQSNGNNDTFAVTMQPFFRYINFPTISVRGPPVRDGLSHFFSVLVVFGLLPPIAVCARPGGGQWVEQPVQAACQQDAHVDA